MTAVLDDTTSTAGTEVAPVEPVASWPARAGAFALDVLPGVAVVTTLALSALAAPLRGWTWWVYTVAAAVTVVAMAVNRWLLPATTGWSLGRSVCGIRVVRARDGADAGLWQLVARDLAHLFDTAALCVGWLWPLWDRRHRTFADLLLRTEVRPVTLPDRDTRRRAGAVLVAAAVGCAAAAGLGYVSVYRQDRAVDQARAQIAEQGPRIVEQMLSFSPDTVKDDFARAQSLVTDDYRPQLTAQQEAVQKSGVSTNEYWAVSSAVLAVGKDTASMLLAMQGQRGVDVKDLKFITATVRVDFQRSGDGQWRIQHLTVLKKPRMNGEGQ